MRSDAEHFVPVRQMLRGNSSAGLVKLRLENATLSINVISCLTRWSSMVLARMIYSLSLQRYCYTRRIWWAVTKPEAYSQKGTGSCYSENTFDARSSFLFEYALDML